VCKRFVLVRCPKYRHGSNGSRKWQGQDVQHVKTRWYELKASRERVRGCCREEVQAACGRQQPPIQKSLLLRDKHWKIYLTSGNPLDLIFTPSKLALRVRGMLIESSELDDYYRRTTVYDTTK
jgi:hypothetical protein